MKNAGKSGLGSGLMKGLGKRVLGPLSYIADATAIASAKPGKERNQAIGSAVGGGIGSTIGGIVGSVIPVAGTMIGSTLGGTVGSFIGEKVGGAITGVSEQFKEGKEKVSRWFSKTFSFGKKTRKLLNRRMFRRHRPLVRLPFRLPSFRNQRRLISASRCCRIQH